MHKHAHLPSLLRFLSHSGHKETTKSSPTVLTEEAFPPRALSSEERAVVKLRELARGTVESERRSPLKAFLSCGTNAVKLWQKAVKHHLLENAIDPGTIQRIYDPDTLKPAATVRQLKRACNSIDTAKMRLAERSLATIQVLAPIAYEVGEQFALNRFKETLDKICLWALVQRQSSREEMRTALRDLEQRSYQTLQQVKILLPPKEGAKS